MTPQEILAEHERGHNPAQRHLDAFLADGVPPLALVKTPNGELDLILRDRVVLFGDRFEFARYVPHLATAAVSAFTWVCRDGFGTPADIAAWRPPALATWLGRVAVLGQEQVLQPRLCEPLAVHADVLDWLRAERQGVVVVDDAQAAAVLQNETLGVSNAMLARQLCRRLTRQAPPIHVAPQAPALSVRAAA